MKGSLLHLALACLPLAAVAAPSRPFLQLQADGTHLLTIAEETLPSVKIDIPDAIKDLSVDDFVSIQESIKHSLSDAQDALVKAVVGTFDATAEQVAPPPHHGPPPHGSKHGILDFSNYTILEILEAALHKHNSSSSDADADDDDSFWKFPFPGHRGPPHTPTPAHLPLHRLAWLVNASSEAKKSLDKAENVTLLAPTDWALTPPHRRRHKAHKKAEVGRSEMDDEEAIDLAMMVEEAEMEMQEQPIQHPFYSNDLMELEESTSTDRKKLFSKIIGWVINYHTIPDITCTWGLASHSTVATALAPSDEPLRISVEPTWTLFPIPHPSIKFNYYSVKKGPTIIAKNGIIHLVSAPLLPPLTPLNKAFLFPSFFSIFTNAVQKVGLDEKLLPTSETSMVADEQVDMVKDVMDELTKGLKGQWTLFAPTNWAFEKLGMKILALLHSPFPLSRKVLKYVLAYHLVPDIAFYSDYINNSTSLSPFITKVGIDVDVPMNWIEDAHSVEQDDGVSNLEWKMPKIPKLPLPKKPSDDHPPPPHHPPPHHKANVTHYQLPTLLATSGVNPNATLEIVVVEFRLFGKGPKRRSVIVLPSGHGQGHSHSEGEAETEVAKDFEGEKDGKKKCKKGRKGPSPVKVWKKDVVARNGAIQVIGTLLRPPYYHHNTTSTASSSPNEHSSNGHRKHDEMGWALKQLFD